MTTKLPSTQYLEAQKKYFWCSCGHTKQSPFCDGTHKGSGLKSLPFDVPESGFFSLCSCQKTKTPPFCDGSHCLP